MKRLFLTSAYKRDVKRVKKQNKPLDQLGDVVAWLLHDAPLPERYQDHPLKGNWSGYRELHITPDWLLIYHIESDIIYLDRTGSHTELLKR